MSTANTQWTNHIQSIVAQAQEIPMWGSIPSFPWDQFSQKLSHCFGLQHLQVHAKNSDWKPADALCSGMGDRPFYVTIELPPIEGATFLVFSREDFTKLSSWMIPSPNQSTALTDFDLQQGFFRYVALQGVHIVDQLGVFGDLTPKLSSHPLPKEQGYCIDFHLTNEKEAAWGRLICSTPFQQSFKHYFSQKYRLSIPSHLHKDIFLDLPVCAGLTKLSQAAWKDVRPGDFVLLDRCTYSPQTKKGMFQLSLNDNPLFQVKIKDDQIKILDYALYYEEDVMEDDSDDETFDEDTDFSEDEFDEEDDFSEDELDEEDEENHEQQLEKEKKEPQSTPSPVESLVSPEEISLSLSVEVARLKMNLDKLLTLKPGNVLHLTTHPENKDVTLIANGQRVARGQLIQVGDVIGVKVIEIGST